MAPLLMNLVNIVFLFISYQDTQEIYGSIWPVRSITLLQDHGFDDRHTSMLNRLQVEAECCGINGWDDFINTPWGIDPINLHLAIPASCCIDQTPATLKYCQEDGNQLFYHRSGCHGKIKDSIHQIGCDMKISTIILLGIILLQVKGLILVLVIWRNGKENRRNSKTVVVVL